MSVKYPFDYSQKNISIWCSPTARKTINTNHHAYHYIHNRKVGTIRYLADMHEKYSYGFVPNRKKRLEYTRQDLGWQPLHKQPKKSSKSRKASNKKHNKKRKSKNIKNVGFLNPLVDIWYVYAMKKDTAKYLKKHRKAPYKDIAPWLNNRAINGTIYDSAYKSVRKANQNYKSTMYLPWSNPNKFGKATYHHKNEHQWHYQINNRNYKTKNGRKYQIYLIDRNHIHLPKIHNIRISKIRRNIWRLYKSHHAVIKDVTFRKNSIGQIHITIAFKGDKPFVPVNACATKGGAYAYDLNESHNLIMGSDGIKFDNPKYAKHSKSTIAKLQHIKDHKINYNRKHNRSIHSKAIKNISYLIAKIQNHTHNCRKNHTNNVTTNIAKNHRLIFGEALSALSMIKHHRNDKASRRHNFNIMDAGWSLIIQQLMQKAKEYHYIYVLVNPAETTQRCSHCGYICSKARGDYVKKGVEHWKCPICKRWHNRDLNASKNILYFGFKEVAKYLPTSLKKLVRKSNPRGLSIHQATRVVRYLDGHYKYGVLDQRSGSGHSRLIPKD